jgi:hypothetical protein
VEAQQFADLTSYLVSTYANTGKTFVLQHWEGDWSIRGGYDPTAKPTPIGARRGCLFCYLCSCVVMRVFRS